MSTHSDAFDRSFRRAQRMYDAQMPPEDPEPCEETGHDWKRLPGRAADGAQFAKCRKCGLVEEV